MAGTPLLVALVAIEVIDVIDEKAGEELEGEPFARFTIARCPDVAGMYSSSAATLTIPAPGTRSCAARRSSRIGP
ncbi:MAG TPA: hypothetical protein VNI78_04505 [Vicinamibacterales bacterium]|nr:hypothetical protein [Vicinamibacterales bacterium]